MIVRCGLIFSRRLDPGAREDLAALRVCPLRFIYRASAPKSAAGGAGRFFPVGVRVCSCRPGEISSLVRRANVNPLVGVRRPASRKWISLMVNPSIKIRVPRKILDGAERQPFVPDRIVAGWRCARPNCRRTATTPTVQTGMKPSLSGELARKRVFQFTGHAVEVWQLRNLPRKKSKLFSC